jgi:ribosomal protein L37AE/L43A
MVQFKTDADGSITEIAPDHCPNAHPLTHPNVIVGWWRCRTCKATVYDGEAHRTERPEVEEQETTAEVGDRVRLAVRVEPAAAADQLGRAEPRVPTRYHVAVVSASEQPRAVARRSPVGVDRIAPRVSSRTCRSV